MTISNNISWSQILIVVKDQLPKVIEKVNHVITNLPHYTKVLFNCWLFENHKWRYGVRKSTLYNVDDIEHRECTICGTDHDMLPYLGVWGTTITLTSSTELIWNDEQ